MCSAAQCVCLSVGGESFAIIDNSLAVVLLPPTCSLLLKWSKSVCGSPTSVLFPSTDPLSENFCSRILAKILQVYSLKKKGAKTVPLMGPLTAGNSVRHTVLGSHILWAVGQIVHKPACEVMVHSWVFIRRDVRATFL